MSSVVSGSSLSNEQSKRSYVATAVFNTALFSYTSAKDANNQLQYTLAVNPLATASNCKAGHILKENGRKLVPGANPGVTTYMVGVFDSSSLLNGFIDPNNNLFAVYSTNLPNFVDRGIDSVTALDNTTNDMGPSVFTNGLVKALGNITSTTGNIEATNGSVSAATTCTAQSFLTLPVGSGAGTSGAPLTASSGQASLNGLAGVTIYTTQARTTSRVLITINQGGASVPVTVNVTGGGGGSITYSLARTATAVPSNGSFVVYASIPNDGSTFYWLLIN